MRYQLKRLSKLNTGQSGFGLVESLISVAILGTAAYMLVFSLSTGMIGVGIYKERVTAENIARTQMEYTISPNEVFSENATTYSVDPTLKKPDGYSVSVNVTNIDPFLSGYMQRIVVTVYRQSRTMYTLEGIKFN